MKIARPCHLCGTNVLGAGNGDVGYEVSWHPEWWCELASRVTSVPVIGQTVHPPVHLLVPGDQTSKGGSHGKPQMS